MEIPGQFSAEIDRAGHFGATEGVLHDATCESGLDTDAPLVDLDSRIGRINSDLTIGVDLTSVNKLKANTGISSNGMLLAGRGFVLSKSEVSVLAGGQILNDVIRPYINGRELLYGWLGRHIIDCCELDVDVLRRDYPKIYQHLSTTVKVEREAVAKRTEVRDAQEYARNWWKLAKPRRDFRDAVSGLLRLIGTTETAKHRVFQFIDHSFIHDHMIIGFALQDAFALGVLSSHIHVTWALRAGAWLGVGNDPRYSKSRCFDPFPFPAAK